MALPWDKGACLASAPAQPLLWLLPDSSVELAGPRPEGQHETPLVSCLNRCAAPKAPGDLRVVCPTPCPQDWPGGWLPTITVP